MKVTARALLLLTFLLGAALLAACRPVTAEMAQAGGGTAAVNGATAVATEAATAAATEVTFGANSFQIVCDSDGVCSDGSNEYTCDATSGICTDQDGFQYQCDAQMNCQDLGTDVAATEAPTVDEGEATTEATEAPTEAVATEEPTAVATDALTEAPTEEATAAATEAPTEAATAAATEAPTAAATEAATEVATEAATAAPEGGNGVTAAQINELVREHNRWRAEVGVPGLKWSASLAAGAQEWANHLVEQGGGLVHSSGDYGENLFGGSGKVWGATDAVNSWGSEKQFYNGEPIGDSNFMQVGHYTQMVWRSTTQVGCGVATANGSTVWVCRYSPPGNMTGEKPF